MSLDKETLQVLRIVDSNLNRLAEGLRVLEDIARMVLDDTAITGQLKTLRHDLIRGGLAFNTALLQARDSEEDVGISLEVSGEAKNKDLPGLLVANARRAQESLRVLEETAKMPGLDLDPDKFKQARFSLYTIEKNLLSRLLRQDKIKRVSGLYVIIDTPSLNGLTHIEAARNMIRAGVKVIQLRDKVTPKKDLLPIARGLQELCKASDVLFIINDYIDLAIAADADGVHVGLNDLPLAEARKQMPIDKIIGVSAETPEQAIEAEKAGADYIGFGAVYPTGTKQDIQVAGIEALREVRKKVKIPLVAIGGINKNKIKEVMAAGAEAAAVISAVLRTGDPEAAAKELIRIMKNE